MVRIPDFLWADAGSGFPAYLSGHILAESSGGMSPYLTAFRDSVEKVVSSPLAKLAKSLAPHWCL